MKRFCPLEKCPHYDDPTKYGVKCYYHGPLCWRGMVDTILECLRVLREEKDGTFSKEN